MEDTLGVLLLYRKAFIRVLILVLMEDTLGEIEAHYVDAGSDES